MPFIRTNFSHLSYVEVWALGCIFDTWAGTTADIAEMGTAFAVCSFISASAWIETGWSTWESRTFLWTDSAAFSNILLNYSESRIFWAPRGGVQVLRNPVWASGSRIRQVRLMSSWEWIATWSHLQRISHSGTGVWNLVSDLRIQGREVWYVLK